MRKLFGFGKKKDKEKDGGDSNDGHEKKEGTRIRRAMSESATYKTKVSKQRKDDDSLQAHAQAYKAQRNQLAPSHNDTHATETLGVPEQPMNSRNSLPATGPVLWKLLPEDVEEELRQRQHLPHSTSSDSLRPSLLSKNRQRAHTASASTKETVSKDEPGVFVPPLLRKTHKEPSNSSSESIQATESTKSPRISFMTKILGPLSPRSSVSFGKQSPQSSPRASHSQPLLVSQAEQPSEELFDSITIPETDAEDNGKKELVEEHKLEPQVVQEEVTSEASATVNSDITEVKMEVPSTPIEFPAFEKNCLLKALTNFEAEDKSFSIAEGDVLRFICMDSNSLGWVYAEKDEKRGWIPYFNVECIPDPEQPKSKIEQSAIESLLSEIEPKAPTKKKQKKACQVKPIDGAEFVVAFPWESTFAEKHEEESAPSSVSTSFIQHAEVPDIQLMAIEEHISSGAGELSLKAGDLLPLLEIDKKTGWVKTDIGLKRGWIPASAVRRVDAKAPRRLAPRKTTTIPEYSRGAQLRVIFDFSETNSERAGILELKVGDKLTFIEMDSSGYGWAKGELNQKRGWFPPTYTELIEEPSAPTVPPPVVDKVVPLSAEGSKQEDRQKHALESRINWEIFVDKSLDGQAHALETIRNMVNHETISYLHIKELLKEASKELAIAEENQQSATKALRKATVRALLDANEKLEVEANDFGRLMQNWANTKDTDSLKRAIEMVSGSRRSYSTVLPRSGSESARDPMKRRSSLFKMPSSPRLQNFMSSSKRLSQQFSSSSGALRSPRNNPNSKNKRWSFNYNSKRKDADTINQL